MEENTSSSSSSPMKIIAPVVIIVLLLGGAAFLFLGKKSTTNQPQTTTTQTTQQATPTTAAMQETSPASSVSGAMTAGQEVTVDIAASNFKFDKSEIKVKKGDKVKIVLTNNEGFHDWVVDEFNARTKRVAAGQSDTVEFTADKAGTFEYYCSVGSHRQMGMKGNLIVE